MELRFRRARRHAQHLGNLLVLVAFHVMEHEHSSCTWWQLPDRLLEIEQVARRHGMPTVPDVLLDATESTPPLSSSESSKRD